MGLNYSLLFSSHRKAMRVVPIQLLPFNGLEHRVTRRPARHRFESRARLTEPEPSYLGNKLTAIGAQGAVFRDVYRTLPDKYEWRASQVQQIQ